MQLAYEFITRLLGVPIEHLIALIALGCLGLAIFAIYVVFSVVKERRGK